MLQNYNLFTNTLAGGNIRHFIKEDVSIWSNQFKYVAKSVNKIREKLDMQCYLEEQKSIYMITENLRHSNEYLALQFYNHFYLELTTGFYKIHNEIKRNEIYNFTQKIDFTELFYNIGTLNNNLGNTDTAIYFISLADKEFSDKNNVHEGLFVKLLLNSKTHFLWNISPNIISDYQNYENANGHKSYFKDALNFFGIQLQQETFDEFFQHIDIQTLFQFISTYKEIRKLDFRVQFKQKGTHYKSMYQFKSLGNLTWMFENYLKTSINYVYKKDVHDKTLYDFLPFILKKTNKKCSKYYSTKLNVLKEKYPLTFDLNTKGLQELIDEINSDKLNNAFAQYAHFALILYLFRNYSSHYMDNSLNLGDSYYLKLPILLSIISCFLLANKTFLEHKKNHE